jgi:hypothetical protein
MQTVTTVMAAISPSFESAHGVKDVYDGSVFPAVKTILVAGDKQVQGHTITAIHAANKLLRNAMLMLYDSTIFYVGAVEASNFALALVPKIGELTAASGILLRVP